jgi:hypothetical protein
VLHRGVGTAAVGVYVCTPVDGGLMTGVDGGVLLMPVTSAGLDAKMAPGTYGASVGISTSLSRLHVPLTKLTDVQPLVLSQFTKQRFKFGTFNRRCTFPVP